MRLLLEYSPPYDWPVMAHELLQRAEVWRPWRGYAAQVLWTSLSRSD